MGIGAAKTKRTHACASRSWQPIFVLRGFPRSELVCDIERRSLEIDVGIDLFEVDVCRNLLVLDG